MHTGGRESQPCAEETPRMEIACAKQLALFRCSCIQNNVITITGKVQLRCSSPHAGCRLCHLIRNPASASPARSTHASANCTCGSRKVTRFGDVHGYARITNAYWKNAVCGKRGARSPSPVPPSHAKFRLCIPSKAPALQLTAHTAAETQREPTMHTGRAVNREHIPEKRRIQKSYA